VGEGKRIRWQLSSKRDPKRGLLYLLIFGTRSYYVAEPRAGLELHGPPASASVVLGLWVCPQLGFDFYKIQYKAKHQSEPHVALAVRVTL
jgi:hypothetical protein